MSEPARNIPPTPAPRSADVRHRAFAGSSGDTEHFLTLTAPSHLSFKEQVECLESLYSESLRAQGLDHDSAVFRRVYLSDSLTQAETIRRSFLGQDSAENPVAVSIVQQPPLPYAKIAMSAYHIEGRGKLNKQRLGPSHTLIARKDLKHLWSARLCAHNTDQSLSSSKQTRRAFNDLIAALAAQGGTLKDNCVRTWIYVKGVDIFYQGMVDERRDMFAHNGLTGDTHFIASTGIEGGGAHRYDLVVMDAYSILGMKPEQISYLNDFSRLCATKDYNVHFERGARVSFADRRHYYISGTASIDAAGDVVHIGDVEKQLDRTLENIEALLNSGGASLDDMMTMTVYLRDPADYARIAERLNERCPELPFVVVQGPVCRPEWLIEIEGIAATPNKEPSLPEF
ncbi:MAG: Rid family hydrolase [Bdellovibrionales bacterium]